MLLGQRNTILLENIYPKKILDHFLFKFYFIFKFFKEFNYLIELTNKKNINKGENKKIDLFD